MKNCIVGMFYNITDYRTCVLGMLAQTQMIHIYSRETH